MASTGRLPMFSLAGDVAVLAMCLLLWAGGLAGQPVLGNLAEDRLTRGGIASHDEYPHDDDAMVHGVAARDAGHGPGAGGDRAVRGVGYEPGRLSAHPLGSRGADRAGA